MPEPTTPTTVRTRRRALRWVVAALVALIGLTGVLYWSATDAAADQVVLRWRQFPPACEGAEVRPAGDEMSGGQPAAIVVTEGFRCTIVVEVLNTSERSIHLDHAVARGVGPETGSVVRVDPRAHPQKGHEDDLGPAGSLDAYVEVGASAGLRVDAGDHATFEVHLVFNPEGCVNGVTMWQAAWPEVHFSVMGRDFSRPAANSLAFFHQGRTPGCSRGR